MALIRDMLKCLPQLLWAMAVVSVNCAVIFSLVSLALHREICLHDVRNVNVFHCFEAVFIYCPIINQPIFFTLWKIKTRARLIYVCNLFYHKSQCCHGYKALQLRDYTSLPTAVLTVPHAD